MWSWIRIRLLKFRVIMPFAFGLEITVVFTHSVTSPSVGGKILFNCLAFFSHNLTADS